MAKHKWKETAVILKDTFAKRFVCEYCGCEKNISKQDKRVIVYERSGQVSSEYMPECWGKKPLNEQGIDD